MKLRIADMRDIPTLQALITRSGLALSEPYYTREQTVAITRHVFGVDSQLIVDRTYLVIDNDGVIVACGGWSKRRALFGGDQTKRGADPLLDPTSEPARIRAFFVEPNMARRGLARELLQECTRQARAAGFSSIELASTLPGEPLYAACGYLAVERFSLTLPGDIAVSLTRMRRGL